MFTMCRLRSRLVCFLHTLTQTVLNGMIVTLPLPAKFDKFGNDYKYLMHFPMVQSTLNSWGGGGQREIVSAGVGQRVCSGESLSYSIIPPTSSKSDAA